MSRASAEALINLHNNFFLNKIRLPNSLGKKELREARRIKSVQIKIENTFLLEKKDPQAVGNDKRINEEVIYPTETSLAEEFAWDIMTGLSKKYAFGPMELKQLFESGYHPAFFGKETGKPPDNNLLTLKAGYVLQRLVSKKHIPLLANADIHFTDNAEDFYNQDNRGNIKTYIPDKRARVYRIDEDENGRTHITYLLRHSHKENYVDAFELVSFLSFVEFFKSKILSERFNTQGQTGSELKKNLKALGFSLKSIKKWAEKQNEGENQGLFLLPSADFSLNPPWQTYSNTDLNQQGQLSEHKRDVIGDAVWMIKKSLEKSDCPKPNYVILGNDFSIPLMATLGLFNHHDIERVFYLTSPHRLNSEKQIIDSSKIETDLQKFSSEIDRETVRKFHVYQYLNRYDGDNSELIDMKRLLDSTVNKMRNRIVSAGHTGLGSPIDIVDFSQLPIEIIKRIEHPKIRELMLNLHSKEARVLSIAYPLGENIYPLVKLLNQELGINNIGFFGKVSSVIDEKGQGVRRGRVVMPDISSRVGEAGKNVFEKFQNYLSQKDAILIPDADFIEAILTTNSVLLQTEQDVLYALEIARRFKENPKMLLDSESFYLQQVCRELGIDPAIVYYISDNTSIDGGPYQDMSTPLSSEGTLAALESSLIILNKWFPKKNIS